MKLANSRRSQRGFTLAELAIVLLILTVLTATLLIPFSGREEIRQRHQAQATLQDIRDALLGFAIIHRRLPCPSRETNPSDPGYGLEDPGCNQAAEGYLPWRTLGIAPFDPWGIERQSSLDPWLGYWRYRVDEEFADAANPIDIETEVDDEIKIQDSGGNAMVDDKTLVAVIYSTGPNRIADGENATYEAGANPIYSGGPPTTTFDDLALWISHPLLISRMASAGALY